MRQIFFFTRGVCSSCLRACLDAWLLLQSYSYPNLSEGADHMGGQLRGDEECLFSGVTKSGRVWRKVPESDAQSEPPTLCLLLLPYLSCYLPPPFLPPSPYPYASIYIQQPHTDTSFFRFYWKGWLTCINCKMLSNAGRQAPDLDKSAALGPNKSVGTRDDDALNSFSVSSIKLFAHNPRQTNKHTHMNMHAHSTHIHFLIPFLIRYIASSVVHSVEGFSPPKSDRLLLALFIQLNGLIHPTPPPPLIHTDKRACTHTRTHTHTHTHKLHMCCLVCVCVYVCVCVCVTKCVYP